MYSKGEWKVIEDEKHRSIYGKWYKVKVGNKRFISIEGNSYDEILPNSQLIASAPELLEACKEVIDCFSTNYTKELNNALDVMQQAINKAEGGLNEQDQ